MLTLILAILMLIVLIITFLFLALYMCSIWPYGELTPPFVPSSRKLASLIADTFDPSPSSVMYELGPGDMRISLATWQKQPEAHYVGIEKHFFPRTLAHINIWRINARKNISAREANFYTANLSDATHLYCYLFPEAMQKLHAKFLNELTPGAMVVSLDFDIKSKEPERTIDLTPYNLRLGKTLYIYRY